MAITGGSVTFEQSRKLAEYENRKVSITFNVSEPEGQDAGDTVGQALRMAKDMVLRELGLVAAATVSAVSDTSEAEPKRGRGRPPKAATPPATPAPAVDPAAMTGEIIPPQIRTNGENRVDPAQVADAAAMEDWSAAPAEVKPITDADVLGQITRKVAALQMNIGQEAPVRVRQLIGKFAKSAKDIPADKRQSFLDELAALAA